MPNASPYRTKEQDRATVHMQGQGFEHHRDSEYTVTHNGQRISAVLVVLFGYARYAVVYPDGSTETRDRKRGGSKTVTYSKDKLIRTALRACGGVAPAPKLQWTTSRHYGYHEPNVTRGPDQPLPEDRPALLKEILTRLDTDGAFLQRYSNGEFTSSSLVIGRSFEDVLKVAVLDAPGYTIHHDVKLSVFWRRGGSFD